MGASRPAGLRIGLVSLVLLVGPLVAPELGGAQMIDEGLARCATIEGALERLDCYDQLARSLDLDGPQPGPADGTKEGQWQVNEEVNPIDDTRTVTLFNVADSGESRLGNPVVLILRCRSGETELYISWQSYLGREAEVTYRVGSAPAQTDDWSMSTDNTATFFPGNDANFILGELMTADQFVAQVTPYNESPITAVFDITGLSAAITPIVEACPNG